MKKYKQDNGQYEKHPRTNNDLQNTTQKITDRAKRIQLFLVH